jgi:ABC-2 type transport system permease protein
MHTEKRYGKYYKFLVYLAVVVLVNLVGLTLFFRFDLTANNRYSLSEASKEAVSDLSEPLTMNVFFTEDLPAPHNNTERYLHDLLEEYSVNSNDYFNYRFYKVSSEEGEIGKEEKENQELAQSYGIYPVQVQNIEQDEVKFKRAYMGLAMVHGDVADKIPAITTTEDLEYLITSKIEKMNNKISTLLNMENPVEVKLFLSSSLEEVAPYMRLNELMDAPGMVESAVEKLNRKYYGKIDYQLLDPSSNPQLDEQVSGYNLFSFSWPATNKKGVNLKGGKGTAGLVVEKGEKFEALPLIEVINLPLFGTQYQLMDMDNLEEKLGEMVDNVIDINKKVGYLSGYGTLPLTGGRSPLQNRSQQVISADNFNTLVSRDYSIEEVNLREEGIPEGIDCLVIAGPKEKLSDYALFQIDQFLMKGKSLAIFADPFEEFMPQQDQSRMQYNRGPIYRPIKSGLEKLLRHYGVLQKESYIMDMSCYRQRLPRMYGGGEQDIYYAPLIKKDNINNDLPFMKSIKGLITLKSSPLELLQDTIEANGLSSAVVFSSSRQSWEMSGRINLNPMMITPPTESERMESKPLAVLLEGEFPSYFAGREIPEKPAEEKKELVEGGESDQEDRENEEVEKEEVGEEEVGKAPPQSLVEPDSMAGEKTIIKNGKPGKVFLVGTSEILKDNVIDQEGNSTNATFVINLLDYINGRVEYAKMRSKTQQYNPLEETSYGVKAFVKSFNIAGLPVIMIGVGIVVWARRRTRKKMIREMFME